MRILAITTSIATNALFIIALHAKNKKRMFFLMSLGDFLNIIKNLLFGAHAGATVMTVGFIRSFVLSRVSKPSRTLMWGLLALQTLLWFFFREPTWWAVLPLIASLSFTYINFTTEDIKTSKLALMGNLVLWITYYTTVGDWVSIAVNVFSWGSLAVSLWQLEKEKTRTS